MGESGENEGEKTNGDWSEGVWRGERLMDGELGERRERKGREEKRGEERRRMLVMGGMSGGDDERRREGRGRVGLSEDGGGGRERNIDFNSPFHSCLRSIEGGGVGMGVGGEVRGEEG